MANSIIAVDSLKSEAVRAYNGMIAVFPQFSKEEALYVSDLAPKFNGCYATNNSTVCFVSDNEIFVTPFTRTVARSLDYAGFSQKHFYVPFSNGDYPKSEHLKWFALREKAEESYAQDFMDDCASFCDAHHIGSISQVTLCKCFEMPAEGVQVRHLYYETCYYPIINSTCFDSTAADKIGHFCANNGKVVFVYRDGKTYVIKGYKVISELRAAGYTEAPLFVPFSNGEEIRSPISKILWEALTK